jgi:hypothetical protein
MSETIASEEGNADSTAPASTAAASENTTQIAKDVGSKPDHIPDKFWDVDAKQVRVDDLLKSYNELGGKVRERTEAIKESVLAEINQEQASKRPETADAYELVLSDEFKANIPEGMEFQFNNDDPLMKFWREMAFDNGMDQTQFQQGLELYMGARIGELPNFEAELAKLGDNGRDRALHVGNWAKANFSEETVNAMHEVAMTADGVKALEEIMSKSGEASFSPEQHVTSGSVTLEELRQMQSDPRYWDMNRRDPAFIRKVDEGYRRLVS